MYAYLYIFKIFYNLNKHRLLYKKRKPQPDLSTDSKLYINKYRFYKYMFHTYFLYSGGI